MRRRLVLLTGEYPFGYGDVDFVRHEMAALSAAYDEIDVFNYARRDEVSVAMPPNATYRGNLFERNRGRAIRALLSPAYLRTLGRVLRRERQGGRLSGHFRQALLSSIQGMRIARHPGLRASLTAPDTSTTVYSFWGMGAALSVPWLPEVDGGVAVRVHRFDLYEDEGNLPLRLAIFAAARHILPISVDGRDYLLERFPHAGLEHTTVVSRLGTTDPGAVTRAGRTDVTTIVTCSSIIPVKRVARVVAAAEALSAGGPVRWVHFGDGPLMGELRDRVAPVAHPGLVIELRGSVANADVLEFYRSTRVDVFVNVSASEGVPVSIMEAMSFGIPVVATAVGGTPEIVGADLRSGELLPGEFTDGQLADAIRDVVSAPDGRYDPRETWMRLSDAATNAQRLTEILRS